MKTGINSTLEQAARTKGRKPTETEEILLAFLLQREKALSGEEIFLELYNGGLSISYPTVYVTLKRLAGMGLLHRQQEQGSRKICYFLNGQKQIQH